MEEKLVFSAKEAAEKLGLSRKTIYVLVKEKKIPFIHIGDRVLIPIKALNKWLET